MIKKETDTMKTFYNRSLIYHSDLICVKKYPKDNPLSITITQANKVYHLILYNDWLLVCRK